MANMFTGQQLSPFRPGSREEYDWFCQQQQRQQYYPEYFGAQAQPAPTPAPPKAPSPTYLTNPVLLLLEP